MTGRYENMGIKILFTTGATVTFTLLLEKIIDPVFITEALLDNGVSTMILQYGNELVNTRHGIENASERRFTETVKKSDIVEKLGLSLVQEQEGVYKYKSQMHNDFEILAFPFISEITKIICESDLVVSHAGTGSMLDVLRLDKPLIVVVNKMLMDNHQTEVADEMQKAGVIRKVEIDEQFNSTLKNDIINIVNGKIKLSKLWQPSKKRVQEIIYEELGQTK